jgi:hypothetical protein
MRLRLSGHAAKTHADEQWNSVTILNAYNAGILMNVEKLPGKTADIIFGFTPDGTCVGLIVGKNNVIISGYCAPIEYWKRC